MNVPAIFLPQIARTKTIAEGAADWRVDGQLEDRDFRQGDRGDEVAGSREADSEGCAPATGCGPRGRACGLSGAGEAPCPQDGCSHVFANAPRARSMRGWNLVNRRSRFLRQSRRTGNTLPGDDKDSSAPRVGESTCAGFDAVRSLSKHLQRHQSDARDCAVQRRGVLALDHTRQCLLRSRRGCNLVVAIAIGIGSRGG